METRPPKLIEDIVGILVPPAYREHVLGDWYERYTSVSQYLLDAAATLPLIIASQIRRTFKIELFLAELCGLYIAFASGSLIRGPGYLYDDRVLLPVALIVGVVLAVLILRDVYADPRDESPRKIYLDAGLALTFAYVAQAMFSLLSSRLSLPAWLMFIGMALSFPMLILARKWYAKIHERPITAAAATNSPDPLRRTSEEAHRKAWRVNFAWLAAALLVLSANWSPSSLSTPARFIVVPLIVGLLVLCMAWRYVRRVNDRAARTIKREIDEIDSSEKKQ